MQSLALWATASQCEDPPSSVHLICVLKSPIGYRHRLSASTGASQRISLQRYSRLGNFGPDYRRVVPMSSGTQEAVSYVELGNDLKTSSSTSDHHVADRSYAEGSWNRVSFYVLILPCWRRFDSDSHELHHTCSIRRFSS